MDKLRAEKTQLRYDSEPAMRHLAERIASFRHPRSTILEPLNRAEDPIVGGVERAPSEYASSCTRSEDGHPHTDW